MAPSTPTLAVLLALPDQGDVRWAKYEAIFARFDHAVLLWRRQYVIHPPNALEPATEATTVEALQAELDAVRAGDEWVHVSPLTLVRVQLAESGRVPL